VILYAIIVLGVKMILIDRVAEKGIIAGILQHGQGCFLDIADMISERTFTDDLLGATYKVFKNILEDNVRIDIPLIYSTAKTLNLHTVITPNTVQDIKLLYATAVSEPTVRKLAAKIRKLEVARLLCSQLDSAKEKLYEVRGDEKISEILAIPEGVIFNFSSLINQDDEKPKLLGTGIDAFIQDKIDNPVDIIGIDSGYPAYNKAIGGGFRPGISVVAARLKIGKSSLAINTGLNVSKNTIPVLGLDTEMSIEEQKMRILACISGVEINKIETGQFANNSKEKIQVLNAGKLLKQIPYSFKTVAGYTFEDQLAMMRRWITKEVGLNSDGTAKPCLIIYDYLKLTDSSEMSSKEMSEWQLLGFMMTALHNFAIRYKVPIFLFTQLNRDGIDKESSGAVAGSDRIGWFCSNLSIFKKKSDEEIAEDGTTSGNRKLVVLDCRHGAGLDFGDYINFNLHGAICRIEEGLTKFESKNQRKQDNSFEMSEEDDNSKNDANDSSSNSFEIE